MVWSCDPTQHPVVKRRKLAWSGHVTTSPCRQEEEAGMVWSCDPPPQQPVVKRRKLAWSGHVTRHPVVKRRKLAWFSRVTPTPCRQEEEAGMVWPCDPHTLSSRGGSRHGLAT